MPDQSPYLGTLLVAYIPDPDGHIDDGYDTVRFYTATSESGSFSLAGTDTLASGQYDYSYNDTSGNLTDWYYWVLYSAANGEGDASIPEPVGHPRISRKTIRQDVGKLLRMVDVYDLVAAASSTVATITELIDADADVDTIANRFARCVAGTASGQTRRIRDGSNGYSDLTTGEITVARAFSPAWVAGDEIELWEPEADRDPSDLIDYHMQFAAKRVWWEEVSYFATESSQSEYTVPVQMTENLIKRVEIATDSYPDRPGWAPVGWWGLTGRTLTISANPTRDVTYAADKVGRVVWTRYGDRMDSDTDWWRCDREWAALEVAVSYLTGRAAPVGNAEDVRDALRSLEAFESLLRPFRSVLTPSGVSSIQAPR